MRLWGLAAFLVFFLAAFASYGNALSGPFFLDDGDHLGDNRHLRVTSLSPRALYEAAFLGPSPNRPVPKLTFALDHYRAGLSTFHFRAVNVALHALAAFMAYILLSMVLNAPGTSERFRSRRRTIAFCAAFLWMLSPVQTQSVSYIVQRMNILAALFYLSAFAAYIKARTSPRPGFRAAWFALCGLCALLGAGSKENAAMLPFFLLLYEWFFFRDLDPAWLKRRGILYFLAATVFLLAVGLVAMGFHPAKSLSGPYQVRDFSMAERLFTQARVVVHYISILVAPLPQRLNFDHDFSLSTGLFSPVTTFLAALFLLAAALSSLFLAKRHRLLSFCILWFFGNLGMESSIIGLEMVFEHRVYLPSVFFFLAVTLGIFSLTGKSRYAVAACVVLALASGVGTRARNEAWAGEIPMWQDAVKKSPKKARPRYSLAIALYRQGRAAEALEEARKAVELGPRDTDAWFNLGRILEHPDTENLEEAVIAYRTAVRLGARDFMPLINCSFVLARLGRFDEARETLAPLLATSPDDPLVRLTAGRILLQEKKPEKALSHFKAALILAPDMALAHESTGTALAQLGLFQKAGESFLKASELDPQNASAISNRGHSLYRLGRYRQARDLYAKVVFLEPENVSALITLAAMENLTGRPLEAISVYRRAAAVDPLNPLCKTAEKRGMRLKTRYEAAQASAKNLAARLKNDPDNPAVLLELGVSLERMGDYGGAEKACIAAERLAPGVGEIKNNLGLIAMKRENYGKARDHFMKALELKNKNTPAMYNLMCLYSRTNDRANAEKWLKRLLADGFSDYVLISHDTDLENLRETDYYRGLVSAGRAHDPADSEAAP